MNSAIGTSVNTVAGYIFYPYIFAGRVAYRATTFAVYAPLQITRSLLSTVQTNAIIVTNNHLFQPDNSHDPNNPLSTERAAIVPYTQPCSDVVQIVRSNQSSSLNTFIMLPVSVLSFSGNAAVNVLRHSRDMASRQLITTASSVSYGATRLVISSATISASIMYQILASLSGSVYRSIPSSVSNNIWGGINTAGKLPIKALTYVTVYPMYHIILAVYPDLSSIYSEEDCISIANEIIQFLNQVLGPKQAFHAIQWSYSFILSPQLGYFLQDTKEIVQVMSDFETYFELVQYLVTDVDYRHNIHDSQRNTFMLQESLPISSSQGCGIYHKQSALRNIEDITDNFDDGCETDFVAVKTGDLYSNTPCSIDSATIDTLSNTSDGYKTPDFDHSTIIDEETITFMTDIIDSRFVSSLATAFDEFLSIIDES